MNLTKITRLIIPTSPIAKNIILSLYFLSSILIIYHLLSGHFSFLANTLAGNPHPHSPHLYP